MLQPLTVLDKKVLRMNCKFIDVIQSVLMEVFSESPANFPELDNLVSLSKPQTSQKPTPNCNRRDIEVLKTIDKETQADFERLPVFGEESKHRWTSKQNTQMKRSSYLVPNRSHA